MQNPDVHKPSDELAIASFSRQADGLTLCWADGHESFFHYIWLRDCCYCAICGDSCSSKRYILPSDIPLDAQPSIIDLDDSGDLCLNWKPDDHASRYDPVWLRRHCYDDDARAARFHQPILWNADICNKLPRVDFSAARNDESHLLDLYRKLRDFGFVVVGGGSPQPGGVEAAANLIGDLSASAYTRIFDLSPSSSVQTMGNTQRAVPPHTDEAFRYSPPGINVLGCVRPAAEGGDSILVDGYYAARRLREENPDAFALLCRYGQSFNRVHPGILDQRSRQPMIVLDDREQVIGIRFHTRAAGPMDLPAALIRPYYAAHRALCDLMLTSANQARFRLQAGDSVLFDNHRVLHSRTEFQDPARFLQICNVPRETFHERLRLLAAKLGYSTEADMVLAAGVS